MNDSANSSLPLVPAAQFADLIGRRLTAGVGAIGVPGFPAEERGVIQVERGIIFPAALIGDRHESFDAIAEQLLEDGLAGEGSSVRVVDGYGHSRPVYRPLLVYCLTQTLRLRLADVSDETAAGWRAALAGWRTALQSRAAELHWQTWPVTADHGGGFAEMAWTALAVQTIGQICTTEPASNRVSDFFHHLVALQQVNGSFLLASVKDNPETTWYHELQILHAVACAAIQSGDEKLLRAAKRNAGFHLAETQPDHATNQPWGLFAFLLDPATSSLADGLLHNAAAQPGPAGPSLLTLMLLADALYCVRLK